MANRRGKSGSTDRVYFVGLQNLCGQCLQPRNYKTLAPSMSVTNLGNMLKSREVTLPTEVQKVKAVIFPVVMYECESWTIKKDEC